MTADQRADASGAMGVFALGRASVVYALGGLAYKGIALLALPLLARLLSPAELGLLDLAAVFASIVGLAATVGSEQGVAYLEPRADRSAGLWGSALGIVAIVAVVLAVVVLIFRMPLAALLTGSSDNGTLILAAVAYGAVIAVTATSLNAVRLHGSPRAYAIASFVIVTAEMGTAVTVALLVESPVTLMVLAWAGAALVTTLPLLGRFVPNLSRPQLATMRRLVAFGGPLVPAAIAWLVGDAWIRSALAREGELAALGEYGIAYRIASVVGLAVTGFGLAWQPYIYRSPAGEVAARASAAMAYVIVGLAAAGVALTALAPEVVAVVAGESYAAARDAVPGLVGGTVALGGFVLVSAVVGASGSTRRILVAALLGVSAQVVAAPYFVASAGLSGAASASLLGYVVAASALVVTELPLLAGRPGMMMMLAIPAAFAGLAGAAFVMEWPLASRLAFVLGYGVLAVGAAFAFRAMRRRDARDQS